MRRPLRARTIVLALVAGLSCAAARADVVAIVAAGSPVTTLTAAQIAEIFLGKVSRFPGGQKAVPIDQPEGSPARDEFYDKVAGKSPAQMKAHWSRIIFTGRGQPPAEAPNGVETRKRVAETPGAIGYIDRALVDSSVRVLSPP